MNSENLKSAVQQYHEHGWAIVPRVFDAGVVHQIRAAALMALTKAGTDKPYKYGGRLQTEKVGCYEWPAIMFWPALVSPLLNFVRATGLMEDVVRAVLGDENIKQLNNQFYYRLPGGNDAFNWHNDIMFRRNVEDTVVDDYVQTVIVVDAWTPSSGGLLFGDGSEVMVGSKDDLRKEPGFGAGTLAPAMPGDVVMWKVTTPHASRCNRGDKPRMVYMNGFCRARSAPDAWPWYLKAGAIQAHVDPETIPYT